MKGFLTYWMVNSNDQNRSKASDQLVLFERQITKLRKIQIVSLLACIKKLILNLKIVIIFEPLEI